jgi:hypothetical protein
MKVNQITQESRFDRRDAYQRDYDSSVSGMGRGDDHRGLGQELAHERNNIQIAINGRPWKVVAGRGTADSAEERSNLENMKQWAERKSASSGKTWTVYLTAAEVSESQGVAEGSLNEFAPGDGGDSGEEDTLHKYARMWYNGDDAVQQQVEQALARQGWEIGEIESEEGGAFVVRSGDEHGDSYIGFAVADLTEGWKSALGSAALAGAMAMGGGMGHAQAADLSNYNTQYLQQVASGEHPRPMVSVADAKAELQARANGKQQVTAPARIDSPSGPQGFSKEYLQKAADPNRFGRYMISIEKAQELLNNMQEGVAEGSLEEIDRRGFLKGLGAAAGLTAMSAAKGQTIPVPQATPDDIKRRQLVVAYFKIIRGLVNPLVKFDKSQVTDNLSSNIFLTYNQDGNILDIKSNDNSPWSQAVLNAFAQAFPNKQLPKGFEQFPIPAGRPSSRMTFTFTPKQVYGSEQGVAEAPGAETLAHNQSTVASNEKAFDLGEGKPKEKEADYGADYQDMVARVKKLAGLGPLKTVYDPQKRVYRNVPTAVQPPKK